MKTFRSLILFALLFPASLLAERPNVILIISDDHAWTDYSFLGNEKIRSPHIDRLAAEGLTFTRGYVTTALCSPSLATMLTGLYTHQHGITGNDPVKGEDREAWLDRLIHEVVDGLHGLAAYVEGLSAVSARFSNVVGKAGGSRLVHPIFAGMHGVVTGIGQQLRQHGVLEETIEPDVAILSFDGIVAGDAVLMGV